MKSLGQLSGSKLSLKSLLIIWAFLFASTLYVGSAVALAWRVIRLIL